MNGSETKFGRTPRRSALATVVLAAALLPAVILAAPAAQASAPASARFQMPQFRVPATTSTGGTLPQDIAVADFNRDGKADVAAANLGPDAFHGGVGVMLGDGAGNLADPIQTSLGPNNGADDLAVADFNHDGTPDLAALQASTGGFGPIAILLGNGDGTFATATQLANTAEGQIEAGDLNQDGNADLVYSRRTSGANIRVYLGDGNGGFAAPDQYSPSFASWDIALADVNTDGRLDLVAASGGSPWTMLGEAGGRLGTQRYQYMPTLTGIALTLGDFDGNGIPDVAMVDASGGHVAIGVGVGDGSFTPRAEYAGIGQQTTWIAAGDFSGDGRLDLVANNGSTVSALLPGSGDGTFGTPTLWVTGAMGFTPAELNGDGRLDLVAFSQDPGIVYATLGDKKETFRAPRNLPTPLDGALAEGDVNGDGLLDVVIGGETVAGGSISSFLVSHLGSPNGRFGPAIQSAQRPDDVMEGIEALVLADVNEDGHLDAVAGLDYLYAQAENVLVALGTGDGTFGTPAPLGTGDTHAHVASLAVVDVTGDGHVDIVSHTNQQLAVLPGTGTGTFGAPIISGSSSFNQNATLVADFTGDGVLDVAAVFRTGSSNFGLGEIRLNRGNGDGTFVLAQTIGMDSNLGGGGVADFNGDGRPDVAVSGSQGSDGGRSGLFVTLNSGGSLGQPVYYPVGCGSLDVADLNRDGTIDIVTGCGSFVVSLNRGDGTFAQRKTLPTGAAPFVAADFTQDGRPDLLELLFTNAHQFSLTVNTTPPFALPTHRRPVDPPRSPSLLTR